MFLTLVYNLDMLLNSVVQFSSLYRSVYMDRTFLSFGSVTVLRQSANLYSLFRRKYHFLIYFVELTEKD